MNQSILKQKETVVNEVADLMKSNSATVVCEYRGLTVDEITSLRKTLREKNAVATVYKNTLVTRAADTLDHKDFDIENKVCDADYVKTIAALPSKEGLVSMLLSVLQAPMRNLAYSLSQVAEKK